jgi:hypothetical protein
MARGIVPWVGAAVACSLLVGAVYLPPRGMPKWAWGSRYYAPSESPQRLRARQLAAEWQRANAALLGARYHEWVGPALVDRRNRGAAGPLLSIEADDSIRAWAQPVMQKALDSAWASLGLGVSKVSVGVLAGQRRPGRDNGTPAGPVESRYGVTYLLPDSSDRSTCLVVLAVPPFAIMRRYLDPTHLMEWATSVLGPCAFYARFGVPGRRVEQWLARRQFDVTLAPNWYRSPRRERALGWRLLGFGNMQWWWDGIYSYPRSTMACFAGRPEECRQGLAAADRDGSGPRPRVIVPSDPWDVGKVHLVGAEWFLSDVLRAAGAERFQEFWTTSLPVDSALTLALHRPVGEYTVSWLRRFGPGPHFGAATRLLDALLGLAFALFLVGLAVLGQGRREVR